MILSLKQQTPEWHDFRRKHITASMAPIILGVSKWSTPYQLFCEITGLSEPKKATEYMQRGLDIEQEARDWFECKTGLHVEPAVVRHDQIHYMAASLDGYDEKTGILLEIKYAGQNDHSSAILGLVPDHYKAQLTHQMLCCGIDTCWYLSYRGEESALIKVTLDEIYAAELLVAIADFWECLNTCTPPPLTDRDYETRDSEEWKALAEKAIILQERIKQDEDHLKIIKEQLQILSNGVNCIGGGIVWSEVTRTGAIDYKAIPELKNIDLERYRKSPTKYFKITKS
jgi:putative phage-type endonuclease